MGCVADREFDVQRGQPQRVSSCEIDAGNTVSPALTRWDWARLSVYWRPLLIGERANSPAPGREPGGADLALVDDDLAALKHNLGLQHRLNPFKRIPVHQNDVRQLASL